MKRPIAMILALLLTAGLFAFVSCGEERNFIVTEIDGEKYLTLNDEEIERINAELQEQGWSITQLKGFTDDDFCGEYISGFGHGTEFDVIDKKDIIAKVRLTKPKEIWRLDYLDNGEQYMLFFTLYNLRIKKVFYNPYEEKTDGIVRAISYLSGHQGLFVKAEETFQVKPVSYKPLLSEGINYYLGIQSLQFSPTPPTERGRVLRKIPGWEMQLTQFCAVELDSSEYFVHAFFARFPEHTYNASSYPEDYMDSFLEIITDHEIYGETPLIRYYQTKDFDHEFQEFVNYYTD